MLTVVLVFLGATIGRAEATPDDIGVARTWLSASTKDAKAFEAATTFPFTYRTTNKLKKCERAVRDGAQFSKWSTCFRKTQKLLLEEIKVGTRVQQFPPEDAGSPRLQVILKAMSGDGRWVHAFMNGDGISYQFFVRVVGDGDARRVNALVLDEEVEAD